MAADHCGPFLPDCFSRPGRGPWPECIRTPVSSFTHSAHGQIERSQTPQQQAQPKQAQPGPGLSAPAPATGGFCSRHPFLSGMMGGLVGAGLFGMLFGHGFGGALASAGPALVVHCTLATNAAIKDLGDAETVHDQYGLSSFMGTHAIGHVRMATESEVDIAGAHPYWAYPYSDVAVLHNGQLTNYFM